MKELFELRFKIEQFRETGAQLWGVELKYPEDQRDRFCEGYVRAMDRVLDLIDDTVSTELEAMYNESIQEENAVTD